MTRRSSSRPRRRHRDHRQRAPCAPADPRISVTIGAASTASTGRSTRPASRPSPSPTSSSWEPWNGYDGDQAGARLGRPVTALLCLNDRVAFGAHQALQETRTARARRRVHRLLRRRRDRLLPAARRSRPRGCPTRRWVARRWSCVLDPDEPRPGEHLVEMPLQVRGSIRPLDRYVILSAPAEAAGRPESPSWPRRAGLCSTGTGPAAGSGAGSGEDARRRGRSWHFSAGSGISREALSVVEDMFDYGTGTIDARAPSEPARRPRGAPARCGWRVRAWVLGALRWAYAVTPVRARRLDRAPGEGSSTARGGSRRSHGRSPLRTGRGPSCRRRAWTRSTLMP